MPSMILGTEPHEYKEFIEEALNYFEKLEIVGIAIVGLTPDNVLTGYWQMELLDKQTAKDQLELDIIDDYIHANGYIIKRGKKN